MRCRCCDKNLNDFESTRKSVNTNEYLDMCQQCYSTIVRDVPTLEREDLLTNEEKEDSEENYE
jgi:hypothetical protein